MSYHGVTGRTWSFPGGTPSNSTQPAPTVTYTTPGTYPVTLTVTNGSSEITSTVEGSVTVLAVPGQTVPFTEGFELTDLATAHWTVTNPGGANTFALTDAAAFSGDKSVRIINQTSMDGQTHSLVSGTYNMAGVDGIVLAYRYAYARRNSSSNDRLRVFASNDCGATWALRQQMTGASTLNTAGAPVTSSFVPTEGQWAEATVNNISAPYHVADFRIKFEFESDGGNNFYIDHINLNGGDVGLDEFEGLSSGLLVQPNPLSGPADVMLDLSAGGPISLHVMDATGRQVGTVFAGHLPAGSHRLPLGHAWLAPGMYLLTLRQQDRQETVRFIVDGAGY